MALPLWMITNAWREIFARIFDGMLVQYNVTPEWLVNPATNRRLKLDLLYPDVNIAVRFEGLQGKQKRRLSLEEEAQMRTRLDARVEVCWQHGIHLVVVDLATGKPERVFQQVDTALSRAAEQAGPDVRQQLKAARRTARTLSLKIIHPDNLKLYADLWEDRQYRLTEAATAAASSQPAPAVEYTTGMEVEHAAFGPGVVIKVAPSADDTLLTVDFITAGQKTLAASLVADKLWPR